MENYLTMTETEWIHKIQTEELSMDTLSCFASHIPDKAWDYLVLHQKLTEKFILDFHYKFNFILLIKKQIIHEKTIEENLHLFKDHMWSVCRYQFLSESFMSNNKNIINWGQVFLNQDHISFRFIQQHFDLLPKNKTLLNPADVFSLNLRIKYKEQINKIVNKRNEKFKLNATKFKRNISKHY